MPTLTPEQHEAIAKLANYLAPKIQQSNYDPAHVTRTQNKISNSPVRWAERKFNVVENDGPIVFEAHQKAILDYMFDPTNEFTTLVWSTIKKSGKTTIAGMVAQWIAETWPGRNEVYLMANDLEQARGRIYQKVIDSIELHPDYNRIAREVPNLWKIIEREIRYLPTNSVLRAVSSDYKGEAGSNPTATLWSELWGYTSEASRRLYEELTPVPTRKRSIRFVETYAGYEGESDLLWQLYQRGLEGKQLTHDDIDWPFADQPPIYVNEQAKLCMYWDTGYEARRMPWQTPEYYAEQEQLLRPLTYRRLHFNEWVSSVDSFIPIEWWEHCEDLTVPPLDATTPVVLAVDAAVSSDCCAAGLISRHPRNPINVSLRLGRLWTPPKGGKMDYTATIEPTIREWCQNYNVVQVAYDPYQLHKLATDLSHDGVAWFRPFSQGVERARADKQLYDIIRDRRISHPGYKEVWEHMRNAAAKHAKNEDTNFRIIKKAEELKIDYVVMLSMGVAECLRLSL